MGRFREVGGAQSSPPDVAVIPLRYPPLVLAPYRAYLSLLAVV